MAPLSALSLCLLSFSFVTHPPVSTSHLTITHSIDTVLLPRGAVHSRIDLPPLHPSPRITTLIIDRGEKYAILRRSLFTASNNIDQRRPAIFTYVPPGPHTHSKPPLPAHKCPFPHPSLD